MWIADGWKDYELLDCGGGEKLERWGDQILVRPDPQAIWESDRKNRGWRTANARYSRSSTGGGHWDKNKLPENWTIAYKNLRFQVKPMNFKHTGLFPEQAANWDFAMDQIRRAGQDLPLHRPAAGPYQLSHRPPGGGAAPGGGPVSGGPALGAAAAPGRDHLFLTALSLSKKSFLTSWKMWKIGSQMGKSML